MSEFFATEKPTGDLDHDLETHRRVLVRRGQPCDAVRAVGDKSERTIEFVASTDGIKRDGHRVRIGDLVVHGYGFDFSNFAKNPVMLWAHNYDSPPIGSWREWRIDEVDGKKALIARAQFAEHDFASTIFDLYAAGHMRSVSIGWTPLEYEPLVDCDGRQVGWDFVSSELLEISAVPIPADPDALVVAVQRGLISSDRLEEFARAGRLGDVSRGHAYVLDHRPRDGGLRSDTPPVASESDAESGARVLDQYTVAVQVARDAIGGTLSSISHLLCEFDSALPGGASEALTATALRLSAALATAHAESLELVHLMTGQVTDESDVAVEDSGLGLYGERAEVERVGKKISGERLGRLRAARDALAAGIETLDAVLRDGDDAQDIEDRLAAVGRDRAYVAALIGELRAISE